ncbi:MAG: class I SAM-dependent methyltransferase [Agriterribacter sp.]
MITSNDHSIPTAYRAIDAATKEHGFSMASDIETCSLLRTLAASKPGGRFLELGTGTGLSTSWILDGMDDKAVLVSVDNDEAVLKIAGEYLNADSRLQLVHADGETFLRSVATEKYDYIFADTWHGKYLLLEETLEMLDKGGLYIVDDMLPQQNWPDQHDQKVKKLLQSLEERNDIVITKQHWASGIIIAVKK